jgi:hypothetical protein
LKKYAMHALNAIIVLQHEKVASKRSLESAIPNPLQKKKRIEYS